MNRTSVTHPIATAWVDAGHGLGRVGMTFCPGKKQPNAMTGAWDRDLTIDVAAIAGVGAGVVVTLLEPHELASLQVETLGKVIADHHMDWVHLPIADGGVPDAAFEDRWHQVGPALRSRLRAGFDIVVHCKGGQGRAGTIAARLLIDCGWTPARALTAVRSVRQGAVENSAQERYVRSLTAVADAVPSTEPGAIRDRAVGAMIGLAVGDAIGTTLEFSRRDSKPRLTDMVGGGPFALMPGQWTDDSAMALALADSLAVDASLDPVELMDRFVAWYRRGSYSCTGRCFDIGATTVGALARYEINGDAYAGSTDPHSAGNGSLMRFAPVAIRHWRDRAMLDDVAARQSSTTHGAAEAVDACRAYAAILADAIAGLPIDHVLAQREPAGFAPAIEAIVAGSWRGKKRPAIRSSGYVVHSLEAALWSVGRTSDFRSAILLAANLGDDADTVAAIAGQLAGAIYGVADIPDEWRQRLAWYNRLEGAAVRLAEAS